MPKELSERISIAKEQIKKIKNEKYRTRALELLADPSDLSQTDFGVCGLAAIIYTLLVHRPDKFASLALEILDDRALVKELRQLYWSGNPTQTPPFDYIVMAGLAYRARGSNEMAIITTWEDGSTPQSKIRRGKELFDRSVTFSKTFEVDGKKWTPEDSGGHFATTQGSLSGLLKGILPKANVYKFKSSMPLREVIGDINRYFRIYKTAFAFMGIKACDEWMKLEALSQSPSQQTLTRWAPVQTTPQPKFEHWVWLSGPIQQVSIGYQFDFWTWRDKYSVQVRTNVMKDYIHGFIAGHVDMTFV